MSQLLDLDTVYPSSSPIKYVRFPPIADHRHTRENDLGSLDASQTGVALQLAIAGASPLRSRPSHSQPCHCSAANKHDKRWKLKTGVSAS